ncbi:LOW QUALITY PROTEIN: probable F-box protein At4g22030 [Arachis duranensis]|uniref:LOW QUALITY PROTEIN: probable F-box protein At4g22030 n=1 Tax=Arachis duranensis TaxID=130453 RepID=A0A6P4D4B8_ARADU|nr:LOW QUALITY PROTEIN: probable F-box protein At4g22030 [Arachis duranensis]
MASLLQNYSSSSLTLISSSIKRSRTTTVNAAIHVPKLPIFPSSLPKTNLLHHTLIKESTTTQFTEKKRVLDCNDNNNNNKVVVQLYAILEAVADRIEMHQNIGDQRDNWNTLLLNSINMITLTATTMAAVAATTGPLLALKLSSALLFSAATGMLLIMNKIQPSQLTEEQRNATRYFKQLQSEIQTTLALGNATEEYVKSATEKVLALDKAFPLPLLGAMLEKFPSKFEPAVWWPSTQFQTKSSNKKSQNNNKKMNGWSEELEVELREIVEVVKRKDSEDYERLGNIALKMNKALAIAGPLLTGIAAAGSAFLGNGNSWATMVPLVAGSLAAAINTFEHGGQVGMVFEMYRNSAGFFKQLETSIESTLEESDLERRENGNLFEMKVAMKLGRSVSQLGNLPQNLLPLVLMNSPASSFRINIHIMTHSFVLSFM